MADKDKAVAVVKGQETIAQEFGLTENQMELVKSQIAKDATDDELRYFMTVSKKTGLDPFTRQIYAIKRNAKDADGAWGKKMTIQTGIDGYRVIAARTDQLAGIDDAIYDDETKTHPNKATVSVYRLMNGERMPFTASARWAEYNQSTSPMWAKMPFLMLGKCAEALALRKAFPNELGDVYTTEEMTQAYDAPERKHSREKKEKAADAPDMIIDAEPIAPGSKLESDLNKSIHASWNELAKISGWNATEADGKRKATLSAKYNVVSNNDLTEEQAADFIKRIKKAIDDAKAKAETEKIDPAQSIAKEFGGSVIEKCEKCKREYKEETDLAQCQAIRMVGQCDHCNAAEGA